MRLLRWLRSNFNEYGPGLSVVSVWIGALLLALAAGFALHSWNSVRSLVKTTATVTENVSGFAPEGGVLYYPRLRFRDPKGELDQVLMRQGAEDIEFPAGDDVPVRYPAGHPESVFIATIWRLYRGGILFAICGVVFVDLGLLFQFRLRRDGFNSGELRN